MDDGKGYNNPELANIIWQIASLLRGLYRPSEYGRVILPMTVLRRLDCVLTFNSAKQEDKLEETGAFESVLNKATEHTFYNTSSWNFEKLKLNPSNLEKNLVSYIECFSKNIREIFERLELHNQI